MHNKISIEGIICDEPVLKQTDKGTNYIVYTIACNIADGGAEKLIAIELYDTEGEKHMMIKNALNLFRKGVQCGAEGSLHYHNDMPTVVVKNYHDNIFVNYDSIINFYKEHPEYHIEVKRGDITMG